MGPGVICEQGYRPELISKMIDNGAHLVKIINCTFTLSPCTYPQCRLISPTLVRNIQKSDRLVGLSGSGILPVTLSENVSG